METLDRIKYKVKVRAEIDYEVFIAALSEDEAAKQAENLNLSELIDNHISVDFRDSTAIEVNGNKKWK